jgi:hypothetical protein
MGPKQEMANLNSLSEMGLWPVVPAFLLYSYFKLVVVVKGGPGLWKRTFSSFWSSTYRIFNGVDRCAFGVLRQDEQVRWPVASCGQVMPCPFFIHRVVQKNIFIQWVSITH